MSDDTDEPQYRAHYQPDPSDVSVREIDDEEDGTFAVRMPIASTGEVRNEGDDPLEREEIAGMARQINERDAGVFLAHGQSSEITNSRYGQTERLGNWADAEVQTAEDRSEGDDADLLFADAVMADPETLPAATGSYREALAILKEQAKRDIPLSASIGWREDDDMPGGNDLMEASIVGIPADPRTFTQDATAEVMARAAVGAGADPEAFLGRIRDAVMGATEHDSMSDDSDTPDDESGDENRDEEGELSAEEFRQEMLELQRQQMDVLETLANDDEDDDDEDEDDEEDNEGDHDDEEDEDDEEQDADEPEGEQTESEQSGDGEGDRTVTVDGEELTPDEAEERIAEMREQAADAEPASPEDVADDRDAEHDEDEQRETESDDHGEDAAKSLLK